MMSPVFVRADLAFGLDDHELDFPNEKISVYGITGLRWHPLSPAQHFGKEVSLSITTLTPDPVSLLVRAQLMRETSLQSQHLGLRLLLEPAEKAQLQDQVARFGFYPTEYVRKYPRIPAREAIQTFPLHVIGRPFDPDDTITDPGPIVFNVENLSPNGILISTQNQLALSLGPGQRLDMILDPRGWFPVQVAVLGRICRILDEIDPESGNLHRHVGVKFVEVDEANRTAFLDLLRDILQRFKRAAEGPAPKRG
ncbi:MAG: PilZ domain-containing protein [Bdellovibrionales bacterium]|nr:PilZ domain-containing protein [Bdellovibrionales bacterium]